MMLCEQTPLAKRDPSPATLVARGLLLLLFTFYISYLPFHLLTEAHHGDIASAHIAAHHDDHHDDHHDHDHHRPHPASDHDLQLTGKQESSFTVLDFVVSETSIFLALPGMRVVYALGDHGSRPGESPPDPAQPRAPPTV